MIMFQKIPGIYLSLACGDQPHPGIGARRCGFVTHLFDSALVANTMLGVAIASPLLLTRWFVRQPFYVLGKPYLSAPGNILYLGLSLVGIFVLAHFQCLTPFSAFLLMGISSLCYSAVLTSLSLNQTGENKRRDLSQANSARPLELWQVGQWFKTSQLGSEQRLLCCSPYPGRPERERCSARFKLHGDAPQYGDGCHSEYSDPDVLKNLHTVRERRHQAPNSSAPRDICRYRRCLLPVCHCVWTKPCEPALRRSLRQFCDRADFADDGTCAVIVSANVDIGCFPSSDGECETILLFDVSTCRVDPYTGYMAAIRYGLLGANLGSLAIGLVATLS